jgi:hypothetical protein
MVAAAVLEVTMARPQPIPLLAVLVLEQAVLAPAHLGMDREALVGLHLAIILEVLEYLFLVAPLLII